MEGRIPQPSGHRPPALGALARTEQLGLFYHIGRGWREKSLGAGCGSAGGAGGAEDGMPSSVVAPALDSELMSCMVPEGSLTLTFW